MKAVNRPVVIITSNNEKELPDAFLRRCFFHYIRFPDEDTMEKIIAVHFPDIKKRLLKEAMEVFFSIRDVNGIKKPSTSGATGLDQAASCRRHRPGSVTGRQHQGDPAATRRATEERAGRAYVRTPRLHVPPPR